MSVAVRILHATDIVTGSVKVVGYYPDKEGAGMSCMEACPIVKDLRAENAALKFENEKLMDSLDLAVEAHVDVSREVVQLRAKLEVAREGLEEALKLEGQIGTMMHDDETCKYVRDGDDDCTCWVAKARATLEELKEGA